MTETQRRIRAYKRALPELRERVVAVALLLAMSASMLASASFAWVTLSTSPEVTGMATTVAANGNLEIALASGSSTTAAAEPEESKIGDSSAKQGIVSSNTTWGNLINLSDPSYGISNIALRPALLNQSMLNKYPLYGARYGEDGRVIDTRENYEFASWQDIGNGVMAFGAGDKAQYGVRAITSVKKDTAVGESIMNDMYMNVIDAHNTVVAKYKQLVDRNNTDLTSGRSCITALEGLVGVFAQDKINFMASGSIAPDDLKQKNVSCSDYVYDFYEMLGRVKEILELEGDTLVQMANLQAYSASGSDNQTTFADRDALVQAYQNGSATTLGVNLDTLAKFYSDYNTVSCCIAQLEAKAKTFDADLGIERFNKSKYTESAMPSVYYENIAYIVTKLADVGTTTINGLELNSFSGSNYNEILAMLRNEDNDVIIHDGVLRNLDQRVFDGGDRLNAEMSVAVRVKLGFEMNMTAGGTVTTAEPKTGETLVTYTDDLNKLSNLSYSGSGDAVAKDTYGMAIDLWVRTNYSGAVLTLEGSPIYEDVPETITVAETDESGTTTNKIYDLYTVTIEEIPYDVYKDRNEQWHDATSHDVFDLQGQTPEQKMRQNVIGYEGENRVWSESALEEMGKSTWLVDDATTQGGGSCFVFYADAEKQEKMKEMLESFNIAFLDENGTKLATAKLNTNLAYESAGKVTVPLEVTYQGVTYEEDGTTRKGITTLTQNEATRITAIVYLDGTDLKNENVLDAGELTGQLNIQFGTNSVLLAPVDEELMQEHRTITASAVGDGGKTWSSGNAIEYPANEYTVEGHKITVTLNVDGVAPDTISGFFVRKISDTQGTRQEAVDFKKVEGKDGLEWTADFTLTAPGTYILSDLVVNGLQYTLDADDQPEVKIGGLEIGTVSTFPTAGTYRTASSSYDVTVTVPVHDSTGIPSRVTAYFYEQGNKSNQTSAILTHADGDNWTGTATFNKSGTYVLDFVNVDGNTLTVDTHPTFTFQLGLKCIIYSGAENGATEFIDKVGTGGIQVPMLARVTDDSGSQLTDLTGVKLIYSVNGSSTQTTACEMTWNGSYYAGTLDLPNGDGFYDFKSLTMGTTGSISTAEAAPRLTVTTTVPLELTQNETQNKNAWAENYQYALSGVSGFDKATFYVSLNSPNATVQATVMNEGTNESKTITAGGYTNGGYPFTLTDGGTWKLTRIEAKRSTDTNWTIWNEGQFDAVQFYVVDSLKVTATPSATSFSGSFLEEHSVTLTVNVTDQKGAALQKGGVTQTSWSLNYDQNDATRGSQAYGGYTIGTSLSVPFGHTSQTNTVTATLTYAGVYSSTLILELDLDGDGTEDYSYNAGTAGISDLTVKSDNPTVKVTGVSPAVGTSIIVNSADKTPTEEKFTKLEGAFNSISANGYSAAAYINFDSKVYGAYYNASLPTVTLSLSGMSDNYTNAAITFGNALKADQVKTYTFTPSSKSVSSQIGYYVNHTGTDHEIYPAGKQTVSQMEVTAKDGTPITVNLSHPVTINQPQYPPYVDFNSTSADGVTLDKVPARVYATTVTDDGDMQVTLPTKIWTEPRSKTESSSNPVVTTSVVYTTRTEQGGGCSSNTTYYTSYTKTVTVYSGTSTTTTWDDQYTVTKWTNGSNQFTPGNAVVITENQTLTPELSMKSINQNSVTTTTTKTVTYYTKTGEETQEKPNGTEVSTDEVKYTQDNPKVE